MPTNFNQPQEKILLDAINDANGTTFQMGTLLFGSPIPMQEGSARNTAVDVTALPSSPYKGHFRLRYNRMDLDKLPGELVIRLVRQDALTTADLLPRINALLGTYLVASDIEVANLPAVSVEWQDVVIAALPMNLVYFGSMTVQLRANDGDVTPPVDDSVDLEGVLTNYELDGFNVPTPDDL